MSFICFYIIGKSIFCLMVQRYNFFAIFNKKRQIILIFGIFYVLLPKNKRIGKRTLKNNGSYKLLKINRGYKVAKLSHQKITF